MRQCAKHINIVYHYFREFFWRGVISVYHVGTNFQLAEIFTEPLEQNTLLFLRKRLVHF